MCVYVYIYVYVFHLTPRPTRVLAASYTRYPTLGCAGRNELFDSCKGACPPASLDACRHKCTVQPNCTSFEFWSSTEGSGAHPTYGENMCQLSSSCTLALLDFDAQSASWNLSTVDLYVKNPAYCASYPCLYGGTCTEGPASYTCTCAAGYAAWGLAVLMLGVGAEGLGCSIRGVR